MTAAISCEVYINDALVADDGESYETGAPTVLTGLQVTWGREDVVSQPNTSTLTCTIAESQGGQAALDLVNVGFPIDVYAGAVLPTTGDPVDVCQDGSFETPLSNRISQASGFLWLADGTPRTGTKSIRIGTDLLGRTPVYPNNPRIPPAPFGTVPEAWDAIPLVRSGSRWSVSFWVHHFNTYNTTRRVHYRPVVFTGPRKADAWDWVPYEPEQLLLPAPAAGVWTQYTFTLDIRDAPRGWLGIAVWPSDPQSWDELDAVTWDAYDVAVTWENAEMVEFDDLQLFAPPESRTTSLVFSGRITDLVLKPGTPGAEVTLTAQDTTADMMQDDISDTPWLAQGIVARINRIQAIADVPFTYRYPPGATNNYVVTWVDVDRQPAYQILQDLASTADLVLWAAFQQLQGFFLWYEDPLTRDAVGGLWLNPDTGDVEISYSEDTRPAEGVEISACDLGLDAEFSQTVADVVTRVDATWQEQTVDDKGQPSPTERYVHVKDTTLESSYGIRRVSYSTQLTSSADCTTVANRILVRSQDLNWTVNGVTWDTHLPKQFGEADIRYAARLLDGVQRCGLAVTITDLPDWAPANPLAGYYLEGGTYTYEAGYWVLSLNLSPSGITGQSVRWRELDATWAWEQFAASIGWSDLYGVGIAGSSVVWDRLTANIVERTVA